jgi:acetyl esterase/lipase
VRTRSAVDLGFRLSVPLLAVLGLLIGLVVGLNSRAAASPHLPSRTAASAPAPALIAPVAHATVAVRPDPFSPSTTPAVRPGPVRRVPGDPSVLRQTVQFGPRPADTSLDVYWPARREFARGGGVLLIHGGGWIFGGKDLETATAVRLAGLGYVAAAVDYRTLPRFAAWPAAAQDVFAATDVLRARAGVYGLDLHRLVAAGWSAGGQLAMLLGTSGRGSSRVAAVISWSGPSDLTQLVSEDARRADCRPFEAGCTERDQLATSFSKDVMECTPKTCPTRFAEASPRRQVSADDVPMLLMASANELIVTSQTTRMASALHSAGLAETTLVVPGSRHGMDLRPVTQSAVLRWLDRYATVPGRGR